MIGVGEAWKVERLSGHHSLPAMRSEVAKVAGKGVICCLEQGVSATCEPTAQPYDLELNFGSGGGTFRTKISR
jgi:hypothetical protein